MRVMVATIGVAVALSSAARAEFLDGAQLWLFADRMGEVLLAEERCALSFDPAAVNEYVATKVPPDSLEFAARLRHEVELGMALDEKLTPAAMATLCGATERFARDAGFLID